MEVMRKEGEAVMKKWKRFLLITLAVFVGIYAAAAIYLSTYYRADMDAVYAMSEEADVQFAIWGDGTRVFEPEGEWDTALIFYPGGNVECDAYWPLLIRCAENGIACMLVEMPGNLAVLDVGAAQRVMERYPQAAHWYLGGHSLGGSMAAAFTADADWVEGLILLAAYSTEPVDVPVLSIYGSEDGVMNREKYDKYRGNLPAGFKEHILEGGNHAGFGYYGPQRGDGDATISRNDQIELTAQRIAEFLK